MPLTESDLALRFFPVMGVPDLDVPWRLVERHAKQAEKNHDGQSVRTLACRGGLDPCELIDVLCGYRSGISADIYKRPGSAVESLTQLVARVTGPVRHEIVTERIGRLRLGFTGARIWFDWRPYAERTPAAREDYDRLIVSIFHHGLLSPLITYSGHVLVGQRRAEIAHRLGICDARCYRVLENVDAWWRDDVVRLNGLKAQIGATEY